MGERKCKACKGNVKGHQVRILSILMRILDPDILTKQNCQIFFSNLPFLTVLIWVLRVKKFFVYLGFLLNFAFLIRIRVESKKVFCLFRFFVKFCLFDTDPWIRMILRIKRIGILSTDFALLNCNTLSILKNKF